MLNEPVAVVFPGQGSQKPGMAEHLVERALDLCARWMDRASAILGWDVARMCSEGGASDLRRTSVTQPAVFTVSVITWRLLHRSGLRPSFVAGHSLGEYSALVAAGALDFDDALRLVAERGRLMETGVPADAGMIAVIGPTIEEVDRMCADLQPQGALVEVANDNGGGQVVLSGSAEGLDRARARVRGEGARCVDLAVGGPFHSSLMSRAGEGLAEVIGRTGFRDPVIPVIANVTVRPVDGAEAIGGLLVQQMTGRVRWRETLQELRRDGVRTHVECGPGRALSSLARRELAGAGAWTDSARPVLPRAAGTRCLGRHQIDRIGREHGGSDERSLMSASATMVGSEGRRT